MVCFLLDERHCLFGSGEKGIIYAIQHGGRIDRQTGRIIKQGDKENDRENDRENPVVLTPRQEKLISIMRVNDRETTEEMKEKLGVSIATIYREIAALRKKGALTREGGDKGGRWIILI